MTGIARLAARTSLGTALIVGCALPVLVRGHQDPHASRTDAAVQPTGAIHGRVITAATGRPPGGAVVTLESSDRKIGRTEMVDDTGRFELNGLPSGTYELRASAPGFVAGEVDDDRSRANITGLRVSAGQVRDGIILHLTAGAIISGRVVDASGEPVDGVPVYAMRVEFAAGKERLVPVAGRPRLTDDRGAYRVFGLGAGDYFLLAAPGAFSPGDRSRAELPGYPLTFLPHSPDAAHAQQLRVKAGEETSVEDLVITQVRSYDLFGTVIDERSRPAPNADVIVLPGTDAAIGAVASVRAGRDGVFRLRKIPAGSYLLQVRPTSTSGFASALVDVPDSLSHVVLQQRSGASARGAFAFDEGATPAFRPGDLSVVLSPTDFTRSPLGTGARGHVLRGWTFEVTGVWGPHLLDVRTPSGWMVASVTLGGEDVTDTPIDFDHVPEGEILRVHLTNRVTQISGTVVDASGRPAPHSAVVVFSREAEQWTLGPRYVRRADTSASGMFQIEGLAPGEYFAAAVERLSKGHWFRPSIFNELRPTASELSLTKGQSRVIQLRVLAGSIDRLPAAAPDKR
ncbi:MAG: hypothetical protein A3H96_00200 [Acidobacteria bacterium RIFCSPLOWO2_02_FULL_67_36]|nr:MAG: hypothetical protein A3H96_00200 [Acidobacteria bacterium RIFCSPLOWO2_02_FULL_67_36]OFW19610.1 MAG: hypothetical protein A3G21_21640 [Acidobacteria bacterium RIFCSPLOWO2_12_FULL_66_21]